MNKLLIVVSLTIFIQRVSAQQTEIVKLPVLQQLIESKSDNIHIINFWATWCAPCVKELPLFEKLNSSAQPSVKVTLVSLDLDLDRDPNKVYKFIERRKIKSRVLILDEKDPNSWIDKIEKQWSGALPATLVINQRTGKRKFVEKELHEGDIEKIIAKVQQ